MKKEVLSKAAKELDELLFEESQIKLNQKPEELQKDMEEASKELQSDDEVSDETLEVLTEIWKDRDGELTVKVCKIFRALGIVPLAKETVEDAEVIPETDELLQEVKDAERVKDLKDIARSDDEFKAIRGKLNGYKEIDDLRGEMLAILDGPVEETEPEEAPEVEEEKAAEPEYEKKGEPKKIVPKDENTLEQHSLNILPAIQGSDYERLFNELDENGYDKKFPIYLYEGKILDGQQRYGICQELGIEPAFKNFEGTKTEAIQFMLRTNKRRNLTSSQWATIASEATEILNELTEEAKERQKATQFAGKPKKGDVKPHGHYTNITTEEKSSTIGKAAKIFNTNPAYIQEAKKIKEKSPEDFEAIKSGEKTISQIRIKNKSENTAKKENPFFNDTARLVGKTFTNLEKIVNKKQVPKTDKDFSDMEKIKTSLSEMIELFDSLGI